MKRIILMLSALLVMLSVSVLARAEGEVIFEDNFDDYTWTNASKVSVENGWAVFDATSGGFTTEKTVGAEMGNVTELYIEYKLRFEGSIEGLDNTWTFPRVIGESQKDSEEEIFSAGIYLNRFLFYKNGGNTANYYFEPNLDYVIKVNMNYITSKFDVEIYEEGIETPVQKHSLETQPITDMSTMKLKLVRFAVPKNGVIKVDYIKVLSTGLRVKKITPDLSSKLRTDADLKIEFSDEITEKSISEIKVFTEEGEEIPAEITQSEDNKKAYNIYFPTGLLYDTKYKLAVGEAIESVKGKKCGAYEKDFTTEVLPFYIRSVIYYNQDNKKVLADAISGVTSLNTTILFANTSGVSKNVTVLSLIYDENNKLVKIGNETIEVKTGANRYKVITDLSGVENAKAVKTFVWDSVTAMTDIPQ